MANYKWIGEHIITGSTDEILAHSFNLTVEEDSIYDFIMSSSFRAGATAAGTFKLYVNTIDDFNTATEISSIRTTTNSGFITYNGARNYKGKKIIFHDKKLYIGSTYPLDIPSTHYRHSIDCANFDVSESNRKVLINYDYTDAVDNKLYFYITQTLTNVGFIHYLRAVTLKKYI